MAAVPSVELDMEHELPAAPAHKSSALTPPTSEDMNKRGDDASSELSDLDMEDPKDEDDTDDDIGEIEPAYYYEGGKIPVFTPVSTCSWARICPCSLGVSSKLYLYGQACTTVD